MSDNEVTALGVVISLILIFLWPDRKRIRPDRERKRKGPRQPSND
jgi:hypothetical protein